MNSSRCCPRPCVSALPLSLRRRPVGSRGSSHQLQGVRFPWTVAAPDVPSTDVVVENSGGHDILAEGVVTLQGGSVSKSWGPGRGYDEDRSRPGSCLDYNECGGRIEVLCPYPDHAGEDPVCISELREASLWCSACVQRGMRAAGVAEAE